MFFMYPIYGSMCTTQLRWFLLIAVNLEVYPVVSRPRKPLRIVETDTKQLRRKTITLLKVQWSDDVNDCTWEEEERMKAAHPGLFEVWP